MDNPVGFLADGRQTLSLSLAGVTDGNRVRACAHNILLASETAMPDLYQGIGISKANFGK
jgi:hypothetical protein